MHPRRLESARADHGAGVCSLGSPAGAGSRPAARELRRPGGSPVREAIIAVDKAQSWAYTEDFITEDEVTTTARRRAEELGVESVSTGTGAALRLLAAAAGARAVAEVGTGAGVSGLWLLGGMTPDGILTSIDLEPEFQTAARDAFSAAGVRAPRTRLIAGRAMAVLPRLADAAYDLVLLDADPAEAGDHLDQALRILRPGGVVTLTSALWRDRVADPALRDEATVAARELGKQVRANDTLVSALLPVGDGLLAAVRR